MAQLFDPRRRVSVAAGAPPFDPGTQLPLVADLSGDPQLVFLAAELSECLSGYPELKTPLRLVTTQTDRKKAASATAAEAAFSETDFLAAVAGLHEAILVDFVDDPERLSAYQLGLALSDLVWIPCIAAPNEQSPASRPSALFGLFARQHLATVQTLLSVASAQLPPGTAAIVSRSLDHWADWIDVNSGQIKSPGANAWGPGAKVVLNALRVQGWVWRSVLTADPAVAVQPSARAWAEAAISIARAARVISGVILRRFWPLAVIALIMLGGLLYLVISNLSGAAQVWTSLATVAGVVGSSTLGLGSGVSLSWSGIRTEILNAAKVDATTWGVTWLPALNATMTERVKLDQRGVAMPGLRKSLDAAE